MKEKKYRISLTLKQLEALSNHLYEHLYDLNEKIGVMQEDYYELTELEPFENYQYLKDELDEKTYIFYVLNAILETLSKKRRYIENHKQEDHNNDK